MKLKRKLKTVNRNKNNKVSSLNLSDAYTGNKASKSLTKMRLLDSYGMTKKK